MLNKAVLSSNANKIAFIDGDCIPHRHFVKEYIKHIDTKSVCIGRSVMLGSKLTDTFKEKRSNLRLGFLTLLLSDSTKTKQGIYSPFISLSSKVRGLVGRNWGCHKDTLIAVNGFDEDYTSAGVGEDVDIEWRLVKHGIEKKSISNKAIVYHMYHHRWYSTAGERLNFKTMQAKTKQGHVQCSNGIDDLSNVNP